MPAHASLETWVRGSIISLILTSVPQSMRWMTFKGQRSPHPIKWPGIRDQGVIPKLNLIFVEGLLLEMLNLNNMCKFFFFLYITEIKCSRKGEKSLLGRLCFYYGSCSLIFSPLDVRICLVTALRPPTLHQHLRGKLVSSLHMVWQLPQEARVTFASLNDTS